MKILVINQCTTVVSRDLYRGLAEIASVAMIVPTFWRYDLCEFAYEPEPDGSALRVHPTDVHFRDNVMLWMVPRRTLKAVLTEESPDAILVDGGPANPQTIGVISAARRYCPQALVVNFTWHNLAYRSSSIKTWGARLIQTYTFPRLDAILCGARPGVEIFRQEGYTRFIDWHPLVTVDPDRWGKPRSESRRKELGIKGFCIGFCGRIAAEKGVDLILRALPKLPAETMIMLVGDGSDCDNLRQLAATLGIADRVVFAGKFHPQELPEIYPLFDVMVLPSRTTPGWVEQFGMVLIEAMASGVPTVGSTSGSIPDVIADPQWIFPEDDVDALVSMLARLHDPVVHREAVAAAGRRAVEFSPQQAAQRFLTCLQELRDG